MSTASEKAFADAALILEHGVDAVPVSARAKPLIVHHLDWYRGRKGAPSLSRKELQEWGGWGPTRQIALEESGELESWLDGVLRRISTPSFCKRLIAVALTTYPLDGPELKARQPSARYQKRRRNPTPQEIDALQRANRREEAQQRREARTAARV